MAKTIKTKTVIAKQIAKVDRVKLYPPLEAVALAQSSATNKFDGKIELHLVLAKPGKFGKYQSEKKTPLLHAVLGKQSEKPEALLEKLTEVMTAVSAATKINKAVVCATMGPGVKVELTSFKK
jgi:ribosomal protein L1